MSMPDGLNRLLEPVVRFWDLFTPQQVRHRRISARTRATSESLVRVGDVVMPFKDIVAAGLIMRRVPQNRIHAEVQDCIRQAVEAADSLMPVRLKNRMIVEEVTRESMLWRDDSDENVAHRRIGLARGPARDIRRHSRRPET